MADLHDQFEALKKILTLLTTKETKNDPIPESLWASAGVKAGTRLKDIEKKVTELKKKVGHMKKDEDLTEDLGEEAFARFKNSGLSIVEFKKMEALTAEAEATEKGDDKKGDEEKKADFKAKDRAVDTKNKDARAKKEAGRARNEEFDEGQPEGLWEAKE
eukprot:GILI01008824.1.p1 GENE.GILI01008824.1~~GILI01008824.1.p1  ORF type:complete len:160 (-),score=63.97 GILI01008824.1:68-547(-)